MKMCGSRHELGSCGERREMPLFGRRMRAGSSSHGWRDRTELHSGEVTWTKSAGDLAARWPLSSVEHGKHGDLASAYFPTGAPQHHYILASRSLFMRPSVRAFDRVPERGRPFKRRRCCCCPSGESGCGATHWPPQLQSAPFGGFGTLQRFRVAGSAGLAGCLQLSFSSGHCRASPLVPGDWGSCA